MTINREHFEAWLFSQPKDRRFNYVQGYSDQQPGCLVCNYVRDNYEIVFVVRSHWIVLAGDQCLPLPDWLFRLLDSLKGLTNVAEAQAEYLRLFPETKLNCTDEARELIK